MEFFIRKNSTLPTLKVQIIKDGRLNFREFDHLISGSTISFSMWDENNNIPYIVKRPAHVEVDITDETNYYVYYQFTSHETRKIGGYAGEFTISNEQGELNLPLREKLYVYIMDSISVPDLCCRSNRGENLILLPSETPRPTPTPTPTPI